MNKNNYYYYTYIIIMITAGLSSCLFSITPILFKLPLDVRYNMTKLAICSSIYHIYDNKDEPTDTNTLVSKNTKMQRFVECLDGIAIILCCGNYWLSDKNVYGLIYLYTSMKMVSNKELVKYSVYFSTVAVAIKNTPSVFIPWTIGLTGLYNYFKVNQKWDHINRTIWHLGNSIFVTMGYLYKPF